MSETKLCIDCKHYRCNWRTLWEPYCARRIVTYSSVITGETETKIELKHCCSERLISTKDSTLEYWMSVVERDIPEYYCGKSGRYWEARE